MIRVSTIASDTPVPLLHDAAGQLALLSAADYDTIPRESVRLWCHLHARYGLPTKELVAWLKNLIGPRRAIEIGSGAGDLAYHLGIKATDNRMQENPNVAAFYQMTGQPVISYPAFVEKLEAEEAIRVHQPEIIIASWVTHWIDPHKPPPPGGGSVMGLHEDRIVATGIPYVMIGNLGTHASKPIRALPHQELSFPWLRSRAVEPSLDRVMIWNMK